jgi:DNA-directed RNA polymerase II subunit RPB1
MSILNNPDCFKGVELSLLSDEFILKNSAVKIMTTAQFNKDAPESGGSYDRAMGTISYSYNCSSCNKGVNDCPGHYGHYELKYPLVQISTKKKIIKNINLICIRCNRFIIDPNIKTLDGEYLYSGLHKGFTKYEIIMEYVCKKKVNKTSKPNYCDYCNNLQQELNNGVNIKNFMPSYIQPLYRQVKKGFGDLYVLEELSRFAEKGDKKKSYTQNSKLAGTNYFATLFFPLDIKERFETLKNEELQKLGIDENSHPANFIHRVLMIPPVNLRHINKTKTETYNNFITSAIENVINTDKSLGNNIITYHDEYAFRDQLRILKDCATKYKNYIAASSSEENDISSINTSIKGKKGIIRNNLLGKQIGRVFRCVITCNTDYDIDEIGIPLNFAKSVFYKEGVTPYNISTLQQYVNNRENYPGCCKIKRKSTGKNHENISNYQLQIGDYVYRNIIDGDTIPICRYPSLYTTSTSCIKIRIQNDRRENDSIGMNVLLCKIFNADFDGDAMYGFLLVDENARAEFSLLSDIKNNFTNGQDGTTWFGQTQDTNIGCGFLTMNSSNFTRYEAKILMNDVPISEHLTKSHYSGRELFSMIMPKINFEAPSPFCRYPVMEMYQKFDPSDKIIRIKNGILESGIVCGEIINYGTINSIYHVIENYYGVETALKTIRNHQILINNFLRLFNVTLNYSSFCIGDVSMDMIRLLQSEIYYKIEKLNTDLINGDISAPSGVTMYNHIENLVLGIYNSIGDKYLGAILASVDPMKNWLILMMLTKSKGSLGNITKILCPLGQIKVDNLRLPFLLDYFRTNIWSQQFDLSPESRGYVPRSLCEGTDLRDIYAQAREGRSNIITKGITTAESGTEGRNCGKAFSAYIVDNKLFVSRIGNGEILQFSAGDDNFDYKLLFPCKYLLVNKSEDEIKELFPAEILASILQERQEFILNRLSCQYGCITSVMNDTIQSPINIDQDIGLLVLNSECDQPGNVKKLVSQVNEFCDNLHCVRFSKNLYGKKFPSVLKSGFNNLRILIRSKFTSEIFAKLDEEKLTFLLAKILNKVLNSLVHSGMAYGLNVSLTLTSPLTQYLIDAHHSTASGGTSKDGINEFKTTINLKNVDKMHVCRTFIFVKPEYEQDKANVTKVANFITTQYLKDFLVEISALYEHIGECTTYPDDKKFVIEALKLSEIRPASRANFVFRLVLKTSKMLDKGITPDNIIYKFEELFAENIKVIYGKSGADTIIYLHFSKEFTFGIPNDKKNIAKKIPIKTDLFQAIKSFMQYLNERFIISQFTDLTNVKVREMKYSYAKNLSSNKFLAIETKTIYYIEANGINLRDLYLVNVIDPIRSFCNDINTMNYQCGLIEARNRIIDSINYSFLTLKLMVANYALIADVICEKGKLSKINVNGIKDREDNDYLLYASYKHPIDFITEGAVNNIYNDLSSPDSSIMMGQVPKLGTLYNKVIINPDYLANQSKEEEDVL